MKIIDLSHTVHQGMPCYPGTEPPTLQAAATIEQDGFVETKMSLYSHIGTHIDAPSHVLKDGVSLDQLPPDHFIGKALVADVFGIAADAIPVAALSKFEGLFARVDFVILKTGWSRHWGKKAYFKGFPTPSEESAIWLSKFNLKGVGIDAISIDSVDAATLPIHKIFLTEKIVVIENLTNLESAGGEIFTFSCMPLKIADADGSPTRALGILGSRP